MNKKLFIFMFLIMASPVFAVENPFRDEVINELPPTLEVQQPKNKTPFVQKVKKVFTREQKVEIDKAKDVQVDEPDKELLGKIEAEKKALAKKEKQAQKELKKQKKLAEKKVKEETKLAEKEAKAQKKLAEEKAKEETKLAKKNLKKANDKKQEVVEVADKQTETTDTLNAGVDVTKIIEVDECVRLALENHPAIQSAMSNAEIYKSKIAQAWSNYFPTFSAGISYSKNGVQNTMYQLPVSKYELYYAPTISANMLLFDFGKTKAMADLAKRTYESADSLKQNTINNVIYNVKQAYYNVLFAQQQVKVYEDTVEDFTLHQKQAQAYYDIGIKAKIDVLTADYNLGNAKLNLIRAKNTLKIAYVQLNNAMGLPEYSDYDVVDNLKLQEYGITVSDAVETAYETSPQLLAAKKKADASEILVRSSLRAFAPNLSGFAGYTRGGNRIDFDDGYQIGAQLNYSNVNLLLLKKQVDEAKATHKKDLADFEAEKQNIYFSVKEAHINMTNAHESIVVAKLAMEQAQEQYNQASGRYKVGLGDAIELKDAEVSFRNAQLDYYNNLLNYHVSAANLERLMGSPILQPNEEL